MYRKQLEVAADVFCSAAEYGELGRRFTENCALPYRTTYGESKLAFGQLCQNYCQKNNFEFVSVRCFSVYGENDSRIFKALSKAIDSFLHKEKFVCKAPNNIWDYIHVDDVAAALVKIALSDYCGIVDLGTGKPHLMRNVFSSVAEMMGCTELLSFEENNDNIVVLVADPTVLNKRIGYTCNIDFVKVLTPPSNGGAKKRRIFRNEQKDNNGYRQFGLYRFGYGSVPD